MKSHDPDHPGKLIAPKRKITSRSVKAALFAYFRFERGWLCADEVGVRYGRCDILVDTGSLVIDVEIKVTKHDLWDGEAKKVDKHSEGNKCAPPCPNRFYICVPQELVAEAEKWCEAIDPRYGILMFTGWQFLALRAGKSIMVARTAKDLHSEYKSVREKIAMRLCSASAGLKIKEARGQ